MPHAYGPVMLDVAGTELSDAERQNGAEELIAIIRRYSR